MKEEILTIDCPGAGQLFIGTSPHAKCGGRVGFNIGVSWGQFGCLGGLLPRREAEKLLQMLYDKLKDINETEEDEYNRTGLEMKKYIESLGSK